MTRTVLLTGISGFIAKRIAHDLLQKGYHVKGSLRSMTRADEVREAVGPVGPGRLTFVELDLTRDDGWTGAMDGVDVLMHTASPFPMADPKHEDDLIRPAVDGTLRAMRAAHAAGVTRVVLTASVASIAYSARTDGHCYGPGDWSDLNWPGSSPYIKSKTLAEKAAREFAAGHPGVQLTTVHPGLVCGTPMDRNYGTSLRLIKRILGGRDPAQPDLPIAVVDIEDVSALHIRAMEDDDAIGLRLIASDDVLSFVEIARTVAEAYTGRKISARKAPWLLLKLLSFFDPTVRGILPQIGAGFALDVSASLPFLDGGFVPAREAVLRSARFIDAQSGG